jgi:hypothetical protein
MIGDEEFDKVSEIELCSWNSVVVNLRRDSSAGIATRCTTKELSFDSQQGQQIFLFSIASRPTPGPTQPPIQWIHGAISPEVKRHGREADHSPPSRTEVKNHAAIPSLPIHVRDVVLN